MTFENEEAVQSQADEGTGETEGSKETPSASEQTGSTQTPEGEPSAPSVDWSQIDVEELYKARPELKPKSAEDIKAELLASDDLKRMIQSEKDKEIAKERRRLTNEAKLRDKQEAQRRADAEKRRLREEEDFEGLGRLLDAEEREAEEILRAADIFKETGENWIRENPEYLQLGEERVNDILDSVKRRTGNFFELQFELGKALAEKKAEDAKAEAAKTIDERVREAVEAALAAAGVEQRSKEVEEGQAPSKSIAAGSSPRPSTKERTYEESAELYGAGEISWEEHKPLFEKHQREVNK